MAANRPLRAKDKEREKWVRKHGLNRASGQAEPKTGSGQAEPRSKDRADRRSGEKEG